MTPVTNSHLIHQKTQARLREIAGRSRGAFGLFARDLTGDEHFAINENHLFPQASAIKIPVLMEVYKQAGEGKFGLSDLRRVEKSDKTPGSGVLSELGDGSTQMSLHDLCVLMILVSDNTATNILIDLVGISNINQTLQSLGLKQTRLHRRMMDAVASAQGNENLSTPAEAAGIMEILHRGQFISRVVCDQILAILSKRKSTAIGSGLPEGTPLASKPGSMPGVATEWAIVSLKERPYVVAVMENYSMEQDASCAIKEISKVLFEYFMRLGRASPHGVYAINHHS